MAFLMLHKGSSGSTQELLAALVHNDQQSAELLFTQIKGEVPYSRFYLYQAYFKQKQNLQSQSHELLKKALFQAKKEEDSKEQQEILQEIRYNLALSELICTGEIRSNFLEEVQEEGYFYLLRGLRTFNQEKYAETLDTLAYLPPKSALSGFMEESWSAFFTPEWINEHLLFCKIALGTTEEASRSLSYSPEQIHSPSYDFLWELCSLKIAENSEKPVAVEICKQISPLIDSTSVPHHFAKHKMVALLVKKSALLLMEAGQFKEACPFLKRLEHTVNQNELLEIAAAYSFEEIHLLEKGPLKTAVLSLLEKDLLEAIYDNNKSLLAKLWTKAIKADTSLEELRSKLLIEAEKKIHLCALLNDQETLLKRLDLVKILSPSLVQKQYLFNRLIALSTDLWRQKGSAEQAFELMSNALLIFQPHDIAPMKTIASELTSLAAFAKHADRAEILCTLYHATQKFGLGSLNLFESQDSSSHLADAIYLFQGSHFEDAKQKACWVLCLDPLNSKALSLCARIAYQQECYLESVDYLKKLSHPSPLETEIKALCCIHLGEYSKGIETLTKLAENHLLCDTSYYHLGRAAHLQDQHKAAFDWFRKVKKANGEVLTHLFIALHSLKEWSSALDIFKKLPEPFSQIKCIRMIAADSHAALGQIDEADSILTHLLTLCEPSKLLFSSYFQEYQTQKLFSPEPAYILGNFYLHKKDAPAKALYYYSLVNEKSPHLLYKCGQAHFRQENYLKAKQCFKLLIKDMQEDVKEDSCSIIALNASSYLAKIYSFLEQPVKASYWYGKYIAQHPTDLTHRRQFAKELMMLQKWPDAAVQFQFIHQQSSLSVVDEINYIYCLFKNRCYERILSLGRQLIVKESMAKLGNYFELINTPRSLEKVYSLKGYSYGLAINQFKKENNWNLKPINKEYYSKHSTINNKLETCFFLSTKFNNCLTYNSLKSNFGDN